MVILWWSKRGQNNVSQKEHQPVWIGLDISSLSRQPPTRKRCLPADALWRSCAPDRTTLHDVCINGLSRQLVVRKPSPAD